MKQIMKIKGQGKFGKQIDNLIIIHANRGNLSDRTCCRTFYTCGGHNAGDAT